MRNEFDFYPTPIECVHALLEREKFEGEVWEPACGDGRIVESCRQRGLNCFGTDIQLGQDFFDSKRRVDCIITNPPYFCADEFVLHALRLARHKVAMLLRLGFLGGIDRYETIWRQHPLKSLYVFCRRLDFGVDGTPIDNHAWFVWDMKHEGPATVHHIFNLTPAERRQRAAAFASKLPSISKLERTQR